jgi:hypothetical protein
MRENLVARTDSGQVDRDDQTGADIMATEQTFAPAPESKIISAPGDLAAEIAATVDRQPGDRVRVTWVGGNNYRCNWWAPGSTADYDNPGMNGLVVTTHLVRKSRFLNVTKVGDRLVIRDHATKAEDVAGK